MVAQIGSDDGLHHDTVDAAAGTAADTTEPSEVHSCESACDTSGTPFLTAEPLHAFRLRPCCLCPNASSRPPIGLLFTVSFCKPHAHTVSGVFHPAHASPAVSPAT